MLNEKQDKNARERELDDFWDISALIPPKKNLPSRAPVSVTLTEITDGDGGKEKRFDGGDLSQTRLTQAPSPKSLPQREGNAVPTVKKKTDETGSTVITRFIPPHTPEPIKKPPAPDDEYTPQESMLHRVRIFRWQTSFQYYEDFCLQATALRDRHGSPCQPVAFFSYVPQYSQMNRAQLAWYLYWRDQIRRGEMLETDYSYILLYIYEIINLSDSMDVRFGQQQLCALRKAFRGTYPRLGHLLNEWICDYSLIHHLSPPVLDDLSAVADCTLKEFYVPNTDSSSHYAAALIAFGSNYVYTKSKFAAGDNRALYDRHMLGALSACMSNSGEVGKRMANAELEESKLIRDAYTGALCSHRIKRRIEIDYCSFARSHELRILVTDIMKYTENRLRAYLGVKSRLGLYALPQVFRDCIDRYFQAALPKKTHASPAQPRQEYEALYDVPKTALSLTNAAAIEANSWNTTERLLSAFEEQKPTEPLAVEESKTEVPNAAEEIPPAPEAPMTVAVSDTASDEMQLLTEKLGYLNEFLNFALRSDAAAQRNFARSRGEMADSIADRINEIAADVLGDILLEECDDGGYAVMEDYRSMFEDLM